MAETKHEKFVRLANQRTNKVLEQLDVIANLANKSNYEYSEEDVKMMIKALRKGVNDLERSFLEEQKKFDLRNK